jgi:SMODS-associated and fused to various effectors sensor domain/TIR domain
VIEDRFASSNSLEHSTTVFLSYAHEDAEFVKDLQLCLNVRGIHPWRDVDDLISGSPFEGEIVRAIEHEVYAMALYITPEFLKSSFIWKVEIPAALRRHKLDPHFHIIPILQGVSFSEVQQACTNWDLANLSQFNAIVLTSSVIETTWKERNNIARRILQSAITLRLRRVKADLSYEPAISLKTFPFKAHTAYLDLDLDWLELISEKEHLSTLQEWEQILLPALLDVKQVISEKISMRRIHLFIQAILPAAIALGFIFRESARFTLLLERSQKGETWSTEVQPSVKEPLHKEFHFNDQGSARIAVVEVATSRPTEQAVKDALPILGIIPTYHVQLELPELSRESVKDAAHALAIAQQVGSVCQNLCDQQHVSYIHLFVAVPTELAVLIGYYLNALCPIMIYEFDRGYKPFGMIQ